jgi:hypothetical protein
VHLAEPFNDSIVSVGERSPGTTTTSGAVTSANVAVATRGQRPVWSTTGPASPATNTTSCPGTSASTWNGPTMSRAVNLG